MSKLSQDIQRLFRTKLLSKFEQIKDLAIEDLKTEIDATIYNEWPDYYEWTYSLKNSITGEVKFEGNIVKIWIYFEPSKLTHTSVVSGTSSYNGKEIYIPPLLDEGHSQDGYYQVDYFHIYPPANFIRRAIERIQRDLQEVVGATIKFEIRKTGGKKFY